MELQQTHHNTEVTLSTCHPKTVAAILKLSNMAGSGSNKQDDEFFALLAYQLKTDYPDLPIERIESAILNGIHGKYNKEAYVPITSITIYRWIKELPEVKNAPGTANNPKTVKSMAEYHSMYGEINPNFKPTAL